MSWNGFNKNTPITYYPQTKERQNLSKNQLIEQTGTDTSEDVSPEIWLRIPFLGKQGDFLVKRLIKKMQRNLTQPVKFIVIYQTTKVLYIFYLRKIRTYPEAIWFISLLDRAAVRLI